LVMPLPSRVPPPVTGMCRQRSSSSKTAEAHYPDAQEATAAGEVRCLIRSQQRTAAKAINNNDGVTTVVMPDLVPGIHVLALIFIHLQ
jgi:hypothetical protein